ncbi:acetate--CoA ligase family protein [Paenibacillus cymbidii]|uniref:acetate--CoA ligase family protein n=1 Tax=Paenibacillus cymbidii TaxID=1639034 RepID=UPI001436907B|nr:acetate--CoA ligase family protein [Paenibacillus cymbidii]
MMHPSLHESLSHLLSPRSAAVVIAEEALAAGTGIVLNMRRAGFPGRLFVVAPNGADIPGEPCRERLADIPEAVELVIATVPPQAIEALLAQCEQMKVGAVLLLSPGIAGAEAEAAQSGEEERAASFVSAWSERTGIAVCGPRSAGIASVTGLMGVCMATGNEWTLRSEGALGLVASGGNDVMAPLLASGFDRNAPLRAIVSTGSEHGLLALEAGEALLDDPCVKALAIATDVIRDGRAFVRLADKSLTLRKPLVLLRPQDTTAAVNDSLFAAVCRQKAIYLAQDAEQFAAAAVCAGSGRELAGNRLALLDFTGGAAGDLVGELRYAGFRTVSPPDKLSEAEAGEPEGWDGAVCIAGPPEPDAERLRRLLHEADKLVCLLWLGDRSDEAVAFWRRDGVAVFHSLDHLIGMLRHLYAFSEKGVKSKTGLSRLRADRFALDRLGFGKFEDVRRVQGAGAPSFGDSAAAPGWNDRELPSGDEILPVAGQLGGGERSPASGAAGRETIVRLSEVEGKRVLNAIGISTPRSRFVARGDDLQRMLQTIDFDGRPFVLKVVSRQQTRKRDFGGVRLHVKDAQEVTRFYWKWLSSPGGFPSADGILVEEMVLEKLELRLSASVEPSFGPVVTLSMRGESGDPPYAVRRLAPFDQAEAARMVAEMPELSAQLSGNRQMPPADRERLYDMLAMFSRWVYELRDRLVAVEIDPLAVRPKGKGVCALDCAMSLRDK